MLGNLIGGFVIIVVGTALLPVVANNVSGSIGYTNSSGTFFPSNVTGASVAIVGLITIFYALAIAVAGIAVAAVGLRQSGLM